MAGGPETTRTALLADLIHNGSAALTAIPLGIAFLARSERGERWEGYAVVLTIFASASVAAYAAINRIINPQPLDHLLVLAVTGMIGFAGTELAARPAFACRSDHRTRHHRTDPQHHATRVTNDLRRWLIGYSAPLTVGSPDRCHSG